MLKKFSVAFFSFSLIAGLFVINASAQRKGLRDLLIKTTTDAAAPEASAYSLDQCRNGATEDAVNPDCIDTGSGNSGWVNGNAGSSNSHWAESQFIAYRLRFSGISLGQHTVILQYDLKHSSKIAIDYLGGYNVTETDAEPCSGVAGCAALTPDEETIPVDPAVVARINPNTGLPIMVAPAGDRQMTLWGGTIDSIEYVENPYTISPTLAVQARTIRVVFTATVANPVLAWGGHIGWRGDWGVGNSAGGISGSPYHMRVLEFDGSGGNQDRSLSADAVGASGGLIITKRVETVDNTDASNQVFTFNASGYFPNDMDPQNQFTLVDNVPGDPGVSRGSAAVFGSQNINVSEVQVPSWTLLDISCSDGTSGDLLTASVTVNIDGNAGEIVTCTFVNGLQVPSAASASISGRVVDRYGRGISGATVTILNYSTGETMYASTSSMGYYGFKGLPVADFYSLSVRHSRYTFYDPVVTFTLEDSLTNMDFQAAK